MSHTKEIICAYCKGKGRSQGSSLSCLVCGARGTVAVEGPTKPCPRCKGAGRRMGEILTCFTCRGKGVTETKKKSAVKVMKAVRSPRKKRAKLKYVRRSGRVSPVQRKAPKTPKQSAAPRLPHTELRPGASSVLPSGGQTPALPVSRAQETRVSQTNQTKKKKKKAKRKAAVSLWEKLKTILK